jgi:hypothetical protein
MSAKPDLRVQLARQLTFLRRSCESFDAGHTDESVRIAVVLRVLFHDTKRSRSLLKQMRRCNIQLLSSCPPLERGLVYFQGLGLTRIHASHGGSTAAFVPNLGPYKDARLIPFESWWQQVVMIMGAHRINRAQLVLAAANKDGGAHVDPDLTPEYEALSSPGMLGRFEVKDALGERSSPVTDAHFVFLRQIGQEVLLSHELTELATI